MKYILNIPVIALSIVLGVIALRLGAPFEALVWYILGGFLTTVTVLSIDNAILDLWVEGCHDRPIPSLFLDWSETAIGLIIILWPLTAVTYLPVKCVILVKRRLEARRERPSPKYVPPTHKTRGSVPGAHTPPVCTFKEGCH